MNDTLISKFFKEATKKIEIRKNLYKTIVFFLESTVRAKSLVPTKVGLETKTAAPRNGVKRINRLLKNKFFTQEFCINFYLCIMKIIIPKNSPLTLAVDWTIIKEKFCFLSVSWVLDSGRSIPIFFDGYEKTKLDSQSQTSIEHNALKKIAKSLSHIKNITIVADRGFDSPKTLELLQNLKLLFVVRAKIDKYITRSRWPEHCCNATSHKAVAKKF